MAIRPIVQSMILRDRQTDRQTGGYGLQIRRSLFTSEGTPKELNTNVQNVQERKDR
jgi:hypothetical protein